MLLPELPEARGSSAASCPSCPKAAGRRGCSIVNLHPEGRRVAPDAASSTWSAGGRFTSASCSPGAPEQGMPGAPAVVVPCPSCAHSRARPPGARRGRGRSRVRLARGCCLFALGLAPMTPRWKVVERQPPASSAHHGRAAASSEGRHVAETLVAGHEWKAKLAEPSARGEPSMPSIRDRHPLRQPLRSHRLRIQVSTHGGRPARRPYAGGRLTVTRHHYRVAPLRVRRPSRRVSAVLVGAQTRPVSGGQLGSRRAPCTAARLWGVPI
jgi:hypothetical protein